ncbi:hypothetical protein [Nocardia miyunensis]|uniref:hypothetical protein n=1 Tax=Nocardia miyunensis TaxID=282684 RepID=UPI000AD98195|nr:hypothetical protein [Nocardia miyunensis]
MALNIVVEVAGYSVTCLRVIGAVLALPLPMVPAARRWGGSEVDRAMTDVMGES